MPGTLLGGRAAPTPAKALNARASLMVELAKRSEQSSRPFSSALFDKQSIFHGPEFFADDLF